MRIHVGLVGIAVATSALAASENRRARLKKAGSQIEEFELNSARLELAAAAAKHFVSLAKPPDKDLQETGALVGAARFVSLPGLSGRLATVVVQRHRALPTWLSSLVRVRRLVDPANQQATGRRRS